jgi:hypothetical protein
MDPQIITHLNIYYFLEKQLSSPTSIEGSSK